MRPPYRMGLGYDVHRLVEDRPLLLGGISIPFSKGLAGHSDADVLAHAIGDALLGAANLGDLGRHFPDSDPQYQGISSLKLLETIGKMVHQKGYSIVTIDTTVVAEKPKLAPHLAAMQKALAGSLGVAEDQISIKATTTEGLGFAGRQEGIAAYALALIIKNDS